MSRIFNVSDFLDRPTMGAHRLFIFALCTLVMLVDGYDVFVVGYVLPALAKSFGVSPHEVTSVFVFQTIGLGLGAYVVAPFADRFGRRKLILVCTTMFGLITLLCTRATSVGELSAYRLCASLFFGGVVPNLVALTSEYCSHKSRPSLVMILFIGYTIGAGGGGYLAALLVRDYGWQGAFWMGGLAPLAFAALLFFLLPESIRFLVLRGRRNDDVAARLRRIDPTVDLSGVTGFTIEEEKSGSIPVIALFREGRAPATLALWLSYAMNLFVLTLVASWAPTFIHLFSGAETEQAAGIAALFSLGGIISPLLLGLIMSRYSANLALACNYVLGGCALLFLGFVSSSIMLSAVGVFFVGWFVVGGQAGINVLAAILYPTEMRATGVGWAVGAGRVASVFGPGLGGFMLAAKWAPTSIYLVAAIPLVIAAIATLCVRFATGMNAPRAKSESAMALEHR